MFEHCKRGLALGLLVLAASGCAGPAADAPAEPSPAASAPPVPATLQPPASQPVPSAAAMTPTAEAAPARTVSDAVALLADGAREWNVLVLGDSTGEEVGEFPFAAAERLAPMYGRPVTVHRWSDGRGYPDKVDVPGQGNARIHIWNGSAAGSVASYAEGNLDAMAPVNMDLVIVNYGHNYPGPEQADEGLSSLLALLKDKLGAPPVLVVLQNPHYPESESSAAISGRLRSIATSGGYGIVDVYQAFKDYGGYDALLSDALHPNAAGSQLWAETLVKRLTTP